MENRYNIRFNSINIKVMTETKLLSFNNRELMNGESQG
jgi:hypothetical protein